MQLAITLYVYALLTELRNAIWTLPKEWCNLTSKPHNKTFPVWQQHLVLSNFRNVARLNGHSLITITLQYNIIILQLWWYGKIRSWLQLLQISKKIIVSKFHRNFFDVFMETKSIELTNLNYERVLFSISSYLL